jgi:chemotaxis signal transduction protein
MTIAAHDAQKGRRGHPKEQAILFTVGGKPFAVAADAVHEIRSADSLAGSAIEISQDAVRKVKHIVHRGNRAYYVVNSCAHFGLRPTRPRLVLILRGSPAAVLVDKIERMENIHPPLPLPLAFRGAEREWYRGLTYVDDQVIPVVNPAGFLSAAELSALEAASRAGTTNAGHELQGARS